MNSTPPEGMYASGTAVVFTGSVGVIIDASPGGYRLSTFPGSEIVIGPRHPDLALLVYAGRASADLVTAIRASYGLSAPHGSDASAHPTTVTITITAPSTARSRHLDAPVALTGAAARAVLRAALDTLIGQCEKRIAETEAPAPVRDRHVDAAIARVLRDAIPG